MAYPGGKAGAGVCQRIINQIPSHDVYTEPFLGDGALLRRTCPARVSPNRRWSDAQFVRKLRHSGAAVPLEKAEDLLSGALHGSYSVAKGMDLVKEYGL